MDVTLFTTARKKPGFGSVLTKWFPRLSSMFTRPELQTCHKIEPGG